MRTRVPHPGSRFAGLTWRGLLSGALLPISAQAQNVDGVTAPLGLVIVTISIAPFLLIMLTSFVKISVVLGILRNALGTPQVPSGAVVTGLSLVLTLFVMMPTAREFYRESGWESARSGSLFSDRSLTALVTGAEAGREPVRRFLEKHAHERERILFADLAVRLSGDPDATIDLRSFQVLIPAFVVSELAEAFQIGFIVFVPFLIIDLVVANVLLALGMMMLPPTAVSLPFKLLLFVLVDGWFHLVEGLLLGYL